MGGLLECWYRCIDPNLLTNMLRTDTSRWFTRPVRCGSRARVSIVREQTLSNPSTDAQSRDIQIVVVQHIGEQRCDYVHGCADRLASPCNGSRTRRKKKKERKKTCTSWKLNSVSRENIFHRCGTMRLLQTFFSFHILDKFFLSTIEFVAFPRSFSTCTYTVKARLFQLSKLWCVKTTKTTSCRLTNVVVYYKTLLVFNTVTKE